ncbi:MAG: acetaldehyde dehydrogenase (acetylating) [Phyllobacteriaceae bacterium]|nr:acetaldehyde dehydrogenase (acetylating) [Phyllobacteriaceae bacterium]
MRKIKAAILGPGNIGADLMLKILGRGRNIELALLAGIVEGGRGLQLARSKGVATSIDGVEAILADPEIRLVFEATGAKAHLANAPRYREAGKIAIDLTPAAVGPYLVPAVNLDDNLEGDNFNMVTCGGQATIPMVAAIGRVTPVDYAEIVATISSKSAGPGTRANIDEFTQTTAKAVVEVGGAAEGRAIILLNPAEPPIMMRNTVYCRVRHPERIEAVRASVAAMAEAVRRYVPGYRLRLEPFVDADKITLMIEVEGEGQYLPKYSGNLDIITAAALATGERVAERLLAASAA